MNEREQLEKAISDLDKQRTLLGDSVVDSAIAAMQERLKSLSGGGEPDQLEQQRKQITVLFADVPGFTAMSEALDHEEVSTIINSLWNRVDQAILAEGGRIDKHIGDAVMAIFGVPAAREDDPERAVRAALRVHAAIDAWRQEFEDSNSRLQKPVMGIRLRVGINTGQALVGTVGTTGEYTAIGDTVNLANRMESAAPPGSTLISHNTYNQVRGLFDLTSLEPISVKGKSEPVQVYQVNGIRPRSFTTTTRGVEGIQTRTVGREKELARLEEAFEATVTGSRTHVVSIVAEAGTGKSRLLSEFSRRLEQRPESLAFFRGRATADMEKVPYSLLRDLIATAFEIQDSDPATVAREKLERGFKLPGSAGGDAAAHFVGQLIGFDFSTSPHLRGIVGDARQIRDTAFHHLAQFFAEAAEEQIVVAYLDDIQWADSASLDWVEYLLENYPELSLLILCLTRPTLFERRPEWGNEGEQRVRLNLLPLSEQQGRELVAEILRRIPEIPRALTDLIVQKAEGSPFYVEELVKVLIESGVIITGEGPWSVQVGKLQALKVPATLAAVLQARLDTLAPADREVLQQASVVGRTFWANLLAHMRQSGEQSAEADAALIRGLTALQGKELIFQSAQSTFADTTEYLFKHAVLHDVTYESVLLARRRAYHMQVAESLIWLSDERVGEYAGRVGEHYELAGDSVRAARWYSRAGKQAQDTYAPEAAGDYFRKALDFLRAEPGAESIAAQLEIFQHLGEVLIWQARYTEAVENYKSMLRTAIDRDNSLAQLQALLGIATCLWSQGTHREAMEYAVRAEELARRVHAEEQIARALWAQGAAWYRLGDGQRALAQAEEALSINTKLNNRTEMARCMNLAAAAYFALGDYPQAEQQMQNALTLFQALGDRRQGMDVLNNLGVIADARGDYETAFLRFHAALELAREMGYRDGEIVFVSNRGAMHIALGDDAAAEADLIQAIERAGKAGSWILPSTYYELSQASLHLGKMEQSLQAARTSLALSKQDGSPEYIGAAYRALAMVSKEMGNPISIPSGDGSNFEECSGDELFEQSLQALDGENMSRERARTLREWARYELRDGSREKGEKMWRQAREIFEQLGAQLEVDRMRHLPS